MSPRDQEITFNTRAKLLQARLVIENKENCRTLLHVGAVHRQQHLFQANRSNAT